ncbi:MAG: hypothetical protein IT389_01060 [Nitrospira sp.]|nr:hypothetical protein [Nitrospira sp.]
MFVSPEIFKHKHGNVFQCSIDLVAICWNLTGEHPKLLLAHFLSLSGCALAAWVFILPHYFSHGMGNALFGVLWLLALASFAIIIGNAVLMVGAQQVLNGELPSLRAGFRVAFSRLPQLLGWIIIATVFGALIRIVQGFLERLWSLGGRIFGATAGIGWGVMTYFVLPLMIFDGIGPLAALRHSSDMVEKTWLRQILGDVSLGLVYMLFAIPGFLLCFFVGGPAAILLGLMYFIPLLISYGVTSAIYQTALYQFALSDEVPRGFEPVFAPEMSSPNENVPSE